MSRISVLFGLVLVTGCFSKPEDKCAFYCGNETPACPDNYVCAPDGWCKRSDVSPDFVCEGASPIDASSSDASSSDASPVDASAFDALAADASTADASM